MNLAATSKWIVILILAGCKIQQSHEPSTTLKAASDLTQWIDENIGQDSQAVDDYFAQLVAEGKCKILTASDPTSFDGLVDFACIAPDDQHGPQRGPPSQIVIHNREESIQDAMRIFLGQKTSQGYSNDVSIHMLVSRSGRIIRNLDEGLVAFHTGFSAQNRISLGIEVEASGTYADGRPTNPKSAIRAGGMTSIQMQKVTQLVNTWRKQYNITADNIVHHHSVSKGTECPISIFPRKGSQDSFWSWRDLSFKQNMEVEVRPQEPSQEPAAPPGPPALEPIQDKTSLALVCHPDGNKVALFPFVSILAEYHSLMKLGNSSDAQSLGEPLQGEQFTIRDAFRYTDHRDTIMVFAVESTNQKGFVLASQVAPSCLLQLETTGSIRDLQAPTDCTITDAGNFLCR